MASPILLPPAFDGMAQDYPRNNMPKGKAWNLVDYIPQMLGAPGTERGGWAYASPLMVGSYILGGIYAPFNAGAQLLAINGAGDLLKITSSAAYTNVGAGATIVQNPVMHQQIVVIPASDGVTAPKKYDGTTLAALGVTAPAAKYAAVFTNHTWLAGTAAQPQRVYASDVGDPTTYATTGVSASYLDVGFPVRALAALPNVLLVFGDSVTARFRGSTPPPQTDMIVDDPIFNYGVADARSVAVNGSVACFANVTGVYLTNGTAFPEDLTQSCGIKKYWRDLLSTYSSSWRLAGGWFGGTYIISVTNGTTPVDCIAFDTQRRSAYRFSNITALSLFAAAQVGTELYAGLGVTPRVAKLSTMWTPQAAYKADGDGTVVAGTYESPFYDTEKIGSQRWRDVYLEHDLRDAATDSPTFSVAYTLSPEAGAAYTTLTPTIGSTTQKTTVRRPVRRKSSGMAFRVTRANASAVARLYGIGATVYNREGSRLDA